MRYLRITLTRLLFVGALAIAGTVPALPAFADEESEARALFVEAVKLSKAAAAEANPEAKLPLLANAIDNLDVIVAEYPSTELALLIVTGQPIGDFDPASLRERFDLAAAQAAGQSTADVSKPADEGPSVADVMTGAGSGAIPVADTDPASVEGRVLYGIAGWLDDLIGGPGSPVRLKLAQPMSATEVDGTVIVRAPGARLYPEQEGEFIDLGDLEVQVRQLSDVAYGFDTALPSQVLVRDRMENEEGAITFGSSAISGVWRADLETATDYDMQIRNAAVIVNDGGTSQQVGRLESISAVQTMTELENGLWDGDLAFDMRNLSLEFDRSDGLSIGAISVSSQGRAFDFAAMTELSNALGFGGPEVMENPEALNQLLEALQTMNWGETEVSILVQEFAGRENGRALFSLGEVLWQITMDGRTELIDLGMVIGVKEFDGAEELDLELPPDIVPGAIRLDFTLADFPFRSILGNVQELAARDMGGGPPVSEDEVMGTLMGQLVQAGSRLEVAELSVVAPLYSILADGQLSVDPNAAFGVVGNATATIEGLDRVIQFAADAAQTDPEAEEMMAFFIFLQGLGKPGETAGTYTYELSLPADGAISVNETPLDFLLGGGGA